MAINKKITNKIKRLFRLNGRLVLCVVDQFALRKKNEYGRWYYTLDGHFEGNCNIFPDCTWEPDVHNNTIKHHDVVCSCIGQAPRTSEFKQICRLMKAMLARLADWKDVPGDPDEIIAEIEDKGESIEEE
jgi:hypothetical protein